MKVDRRERRKGGECLKMGETEKDKSNGRGGRRWEGVGERQEEGRRRGER